MQIDDEFNPAWRWIPMKVCLLLDDDTLAVGTHLPLNPFMPVAPKNILFGYMS